MYKLNFYLLHQIMSIFLKKTKKEKPQGFSSSINVLKSVKKL